MKFFYSASVMGYGNGRKWHSKYEFPSFPRVTKTLTVKPRKGIPFAIIKCRDSVWNMVGLHNIGFNKFFSEIDLLKDNRNIIISLAGFDHEIEYMVGILNNSSIVFGGIELNFSCPNVKDYKNKSIPVSKYPLHLKLNCYQDPYEYDLNDVVSIRLNSVPCVIGGISGKAARQKNWKFIKKFNKEGLNVAGCSITEQYDINRLEDLGCTEVGIGSIILTNTKVVELLKMR